MSAPQRLSHRFHCRGVNLGASIDQLGPGEYPYLLNARPLQQGGVTTRPGQTLTTPFSAPVHSIRTLNNLATSTTKQVIGSGTQLYLDSVSVASGFSGDPLSLVRFRPDQSTESWMYVADTNRMLKVSTESVVKNVGIAPPVVAPVTEIASNLITNISTFNTATGWTTGAVVSRAPGGTAIEAVLYDSGSGIGFACIVPTGNDFSWAQAGMEIILPSTGETAVVISVSNAIATSTVASIMYDGAVPGLCTVVLDTSTQGLDHNSVVKIGAEYVRVLSANVGPDGLYSFRCFTQIFHTSTEQVLGKVSMRSFLDNTYVTGDLILGVSLQYTATMGAPLNSQLQSPVLDLSQIVGRPVGPDDYMHISIMLDKPGNLSYGRVLLDVDATTNDFTQNYYQKEFRASDLEPAVDGTSSTLVASLDAIANTQVEQSATDYVSGDIYTAPDFGPGSNQSDVSLPDSIQLSTGNSQWTELNFNISELQRVGTDITRSLKNVAAIGLQMVVTADTVVTVSSWWVAGTYGPDVTPGSPVGIIYRYRYRDTSTGARSIPGPATRYQVFPFRQWVSVQCAQSPDPACDIIDIERLDPNLQVSGQPPQWRYTGSVPNTGGNFTYSDFNTVEYIEGTQPLELNVIQPFVTLLPPIDTTATVVGTSVLLNYVLPPKLLQDTVIRLNGVAYQIFATPTPGSTTTFLELVQSAGFNSGQVSAQIDSPNVYGQPLPFTFGPLEGPTASFVFGLGDTNNPGFLYWCNGNDPDSMDSSNYIEITPPSEPLVSGAVWNTYVFVASRDRVFLIQPTFDQPNLFTPVQVRSNSGCQGRWLMAAGADGVYMGGRDGVYRATPYAGADNISHELWPLFPHEGLPGQGVNGYFPISYSYTDQLRIADGDPYLLSGGMAWRYGLVWPDRDFQPPIDRGWFPESYPVTPLTVYLEELPTENRSLTPPKLFQGCSNGVQTVGAGTDNNATITANVTLPPLKPGGDTRANNLYIDCITDLVGQATIILYANLNTITINPGAAISQPVRGLAITNIDQTGNLALYRDVTANYLFNFGTTLYEYQPQYFPQPVTMTNYVQQNTDHGIPGWKLTRWLRMGVICSGVTTLTVTTSEGETFTYTLQPTNGLGGLSTQDMNAVFTMKARLYGYDLSGPPFVMFPQNCYVRMKKFGTDGAFQEVPIFAAN